MNEEHIFTKSVEKNNYTVIDCLMCGWWHVFPIPTALELKDYYEKNYYSQVIRPDRTMTDKLLDPDGFYAAQYEDRWRRLTKLLPTALPQTVFDIGSGYGDWLRFIKAKGWQTQGIEPSEEVCGAIPDREALRIKHGLVENLKELVEQPMSVVTINNVLEHVRDPKQVLETVKNYVLKPQGILCVIVPNDFSPLQELLRQTALKDSPDKQYYWVTPLEHLNYWSYETIKIFLAKAGYKILYITGDFPMELFALLGDNYLEDRQLGKKIHAKRMMFEKYFDMAQAVDLKDDFFKSLAGSGIGRNIQLYAALRRNFVN